MLCFALVLCLFRGWILTLAVGCCSLFLFGVDCVDVCFDCCGFAVVVFVVC